MIVRNFIECNNVNKKRGQLHISKLVLSNIIRDRSKLIGYLGEDHQQGGEEFFSKEIGGGGEILFEKIGARLFLVNILKIIISILK